MTAESPLLVFERRGQLFACPSADVLEIVEEPALDDPGYATPLVAGVLLHGGRFIPAVDPASVFDHPAERRGDAVLIQGPAGIAALLADTVLGFRTPRALAPAPWLPAGRICRSAAQIDGLGRAFVFAAEGLGDVPAAPCAALDGTAPPVPSEDRAAGSRGGGPPGGGAMHLVFTIGARSFAAAFGDVRRILHRQRPFRLPGAIPPVRHVVDMIGAVVPVLDLAGQEHPPERGDFVVLSSSAGPLALRVDGIERPLALTPDAAEPGWFPSPGVTGIARLDDRAYAVVTGERLLHDLLSERPPVEGLSA